MRLFWVSCLCSSSTFDELFKELKNKPEVSIQHYLALLISGLSNNGIKNTTLCDRQISRGNGRLFWRGYKEQDNNDHIIEYLPFISIPVVSQIVRFCAVIIKLIGYLLRREKPQLVICDVMRFWVSTPALLFGKIFGVKMVGFAADIPQMYLHQYKGNISWIHSLQRKFYSSITTHYDAYIELSSYMDEHINPKNRPMIVVEGLVDSTSVVNHQDRQIERQTSSNNIILMYTGGLYEKYGVKMLIDAVASRKDSKIELWLLGKGELEEYLSTLNNANIKYFGYCPHDKVVTMQQQADFLINPRFSNEDYTKYSFPSKIMEYLVSGTPVISTRLKGIPDVYFNYIIPIEEETVEGLSVVLDQILQMDTDELNTLGNKGRDFVLKNKNNSVQAKRIVDWLETLE